MEKLPEASVLEILSLLDDSADVARCRYAWKTFNTVFPGLRSINLSWPLQSHIESSSRVSNPSSSSQETSFKKIFLKLISKLTVVDSVRIGAKNLPDYMLNAGVEATANDLYLTDGDFTNDWLPGVSESLKFLSISDFWIQSRHRRSYILSLVSTHCHNLVELELKNAWLSVDNLNPMQMLTTLTLERIRLDDRELSQVNECCFNLQVINLIDVRGLKLPTIRLRNLNTCHWTVTDQPLDLILVTPNLIRLKVESRIPTGLIVEAPMLSHFHISFDRVDAFTSEKFENLKTLWLEASYIRGLLRRFPHTETVENLTLDSRGLLKGPLGEFKFTIYQLFSVFPKLTSLCFKSRAWLEFDVKHNYCSWVAVNEMKGLKTFRGYLLMKDLPMALSSLLPCVLDQCENLVDVSLFIHRDVYNFVLRYTILKCMERWPKLNWRWGLWKEGTEDFWVSDVYLRRILYERPVMEDEIQYPKKQRI